MRNKLTILMLTLLAASSLWISKVEAFPFIEVEGFVNLGKAIVTDNGNGTSTFSQVDYLFSVKNSFNGAGMILLSLEFENDVFASTGTISPFAPIDWSTSQIPFGNSIYLLAEGGTPVAVGESLSFSMLDVIVFNGALSNPSLWQEGDVWSQSWFAMDTRGGGDGGSTALTPEPSTLLLLGSGLLGLGFWRRKRLRT